MIYIKLFYNFFLVGLLSFGGGYSSIPLIREVANNFGHYTDETIANFIAIAESTPGPTAVNLATFIGTEEAGIIGAIIATFAEVLPAFVIILIFAKVSSKFIDNKNVQFVLSVIRPSVIGIIMSVGVYMIFENLYIVSMLNGTYMNATYSSSFDIMPIVKSIIIFIIIIISMFTYKKIFNKKMDAIKLIIIGGILGILINLI